MLMYTICMLERRVSFEGAVPQPLQLAVRYQQKVYSLVPRSLREEPKAVSYMEVMYCNELV